jgi:hypothetical protein
MVMNCQEVFCALTYLAKKKAASIALPRLLTIDKICYQGQTALKIFQFLQKERPSFSSKNCQFIDFYNT